MTPEWRDAVPAIEATVPADRAVSEEAASRDGIPDDTGGARVRHGWRAARRLFATAAHLLHGTAISFGVFRFLSADGRESRIVWWAARMLHVLQVRAEVRGTLHPGPVLLLANHVSWLDIVAIQSIHPVRFVSKSDVRRWPVIGRLAANAETVFIERHGRRDAHRVVHEIAEVLRGGRIVAVFPEGTTGTGPVVLPFHSNLVQASIVAGTRVQPVVLRYSDRHGRFSAAAAFAGSTTLAASLWQVACADELTAHVTFLPPIDGGHRDRRALAAIVQGRIQAALDEPGDHRPCE